MYDCTIIGDTTLDRFLQLPDIEKFPSTTNPGNLNIVLEVGTKLPIDQIIESPGGNAYNVAVGLTKLSCQSLIYSFIGDDQNAPLIHTYLTEQGLSMEFIQQNPGEKTNSSTILSMSGDRIIFSHHAKRTYRYQDIPPCPWIYLTSMGEGNEVIIEPVLEKVRTTEAKLAFNPGSYMLREQMEMIHRILPALEIIFINKEEAQAITGNSTEDISTLIHLLHEQGPRMIALTDASKGAYLSVSDTIWHQGAIGDLTIETTGAGDAFSSGCMAGLIQNSSPQQALVYGVINSGHVIREVGSTNGLLDSEQMRQAVHSYALSPTLL